MPSSLLTTGWKSGLEAFSQPCGTPLPSAVSTTWASPMPSHLMMSKVKWRFCYTGFFQYQKLQVRTSNQRYFTLRLQMRFNIFNVYNFISWGKKGKSSVCVCVCVCDYLCICWHQTYMFLTVKGEIKRNTRHINLFQFIFDNYRKKRFLKYFLFSFNPCTFRNLFDLKYQTGNEWPVWCFSFEIVHIVKCTLVLN